MHQNKSFITYVNNKKSFTLTVFGFSIVTTWNIGISVRKIKLTISTITLLAKYTLALKMKKVKLTFTSSLIKLAMNFTLALKVKKIVFVSVMKQLMQFLFSLKATKITLTCAIKLATKLGSWLPKVPKVSFVLSPILARFIALITYDPQTLTAMDSISLIDLDYVLA